MARFSGELSSPVNNVLTPVWVLVFVSRQALTIAVAVLSDRAAASGRLTNRIILHILMHGCNVFAPVQRAINGTIGIINSIIVGSLAKSTA